VRRAPPRPRSDEAKKARRRKRRRKKEKEEAKKKFGEMTEKLTRSEGFFTLWHDDDSLLLELKKAD
jgi:hypothetical protein